MDKPVNSSRIPRELLHEQNDRLSSKHIQTLSFLKDLAEENKQLKLRVKELEAEQLKCEEFHTLADESRERIKELQEEYLKRADEINIELTEKHNAEMMSVVGEKLDQEKYYLEEIVKMRDEIDDLERMNLSLVSQNKGLNQADDQLPIALSKIKQHENEIEKCREEKNELREELDDKICQLQDLLSIKENHETLFHDFHEAKQKNTELQFRVSRLEKDLKLAEGDKDQVEMVDQLKFKLEKVLKEREAKSDMVKEQSVLIENLKDKIEKLRSSLVRTREEKEDIVIEHSKTIAELAQLKKQLLKSKDGSSFKDFIALKREIKILREENEKLQQLLFSASNTSLPSLKTENYNSRPKSSSVSLKSKKSSLSYY